MKFNKRPLSPNTSKRKKFKAYYCPQCHTICDSDEEAAYCSCTTVAPEDVRQLIIDGFWKLAQVNILFAGADPKLPLLRKAKKGTIQDVQK